MVRAGRERPGFMILTDDGHAAWAGALEEALGMPGCVAAWHDDIEGYEGVLTAFYDRCAGCGVRSVAALGTACVPALALASHLAVNRLALVDAAIALHPTQKRLLRFAQRNLALCGADVLWVGEATDGRLIRVQRQLCRSHGVCLSIGGDTANDLWTKCEFSVKNAICGFLRSGVHSKLLAENAEMCIIYG